MSLGTQRTGADERRVTAEAGVAQPQISAVPARGGVTSRAVAIALLLMPLNALWVIRMEAVMAGPFPTLISLFCNMVFLLAAFVGLNACLHRYLPRLAFSQGELLTMYTMLAICTGLAGQSNIDILCQTVTHGAWFASASNGWASFLDAFPAWLTVHDRAEVRGHFQGNASFHDPAVLRAWVVPILAWTLFYTLLGLVGYCLSALVRKQWADRERLTFPITWLPLQMTEGGTGAPFFRSRVMWAGFLTAALPNLWNGFAYMYPSMPHLPLDITDLHPLMTSKPWSALGWFPVTFYPLMIGLGFLLPLDLLFSCWFFFLFSRAQVVVSNVMAWDTVPNFPFLTEQGFGAVAGLFVYYVWSGRRHWIEIGRAVVKGRREELSDPSLQEPLSERAAVAGAVLGFAGLTLFGLAAGMTPWVALAFFGILVAMMVVVARVRAELGSPVHDFYPMGPDTMLPRLWGTPAFRQGDLAFFTLNYGLCSSRCDDTMPIGLEGMQMARRSGTEARRFFWALLLATAVGAVCCFWGFEHQAYTLGAAAKWRAGQYAGRETFARMAGWHDGSLDYWPNGRALVATLAGGGVTLLLLALRTRYYGFPLHPMGYPVALSWMMNLAWMPLLIAWILKGVTLRWGGRRAYHLFLPYFLGMVLGDSVIGCGWGLLGLLLNVKMYNFFGA